MFRKNPFAIGQIHHIYNRGVAKGSICNKEADFWRFLQGLCLFNDQKSAISVLWRLEHNRGRLSMNVLKDYLVREGTAREPLVRILAYCVLDNHYHLLVEEIREGGITQFMRKLGTGYAQYFNKKYDRVGSLFQNVFKNIRVDSEQYLQYLLVYINVMNPASMVEPNWKEEGFRDIKKVLERAQKYQWSSHLDYLGERGSIILDRGVFATLVPTPKSYLYLVKSVLEEKKYREIGSLLFE